MNKKNKTHHELKFEAYKLKIEGWVNWLQSTTVQLLTLLILILLIPGFCQTTSAQERELHYRGYASFSVASGETPFWHYSNTRGLIHPGSTFNHITGISAILSEKPIIDGLYFYAGLEVANRLSNTQNTAHFQQLFASLEYGSFRLNIGRFHETLGMSMDELSTGSMMVSKNATPVPKISLEMIRFADIPFTNGFAQFRGYYSDGILDTERHIKRPLLHQKSLYLKFNIERAELIGGFSHNVKWGGEDPERGKLPQSFSDYRRVVIPRPAEPGTGASPGEERNRLGNTVAAYDMAVRYNFDNFTLTGFRMIYLEDTVSLKLRSFWDGTYGIGFQNNNDDAAITGVLYEFMNTIRQDSQGHYPRGRINYYGHHIYHSGWSYYGNVLGNPLIIYDRDQLRVTNNMIIGHHLGIKGNLTNRLEYRVLATYSRNYGLCEDQIITGRCFINSESPAPPDLETISRSELRQDQYSTLFEVDYAISRKRGIHIHGSFAFDVGEFQPNSMGFSAGISWSRIY